MHQTPAPTRPSARQSAPWRISGLHLIQPQETTQIVSNSGPDCNEGPEQDFGPVNPSHNLTSHITKTGVSPRSHLAHNVVAYAGRWPGEPPGDTPKYKLPPGFRKSIELFNVDRAVKESTDRPLVIVEGFFDCMKLHQLGCRRVVALMGSTMSAAQEELIRKHTDSKSQVIVMLDEDEAGQAGREDIAVRLAKFLFVKVHAFEKPDTQPDNLTAEQVSALFI